MSDILSTVDLLVENIFASRRTLSKRTDLKLPPALPQGHYPPELSVATWGTALYATREQFVAPPFNVNDIDMAVRLDGIAARGINKYEQLMFKEGVLLEGERPELVDYVYGRFAIFGARGPETFDSLMKAIASDLVRYSNCILVKSRYRTNDMSQVNAQMKLRLGRTLRGVTGVNPVSSYWRQEVGQIEARQDDRGIPIEYHQKQNEEEVDKWSAKDVVHIAHDKAAKSIWGRPLTLPVIDDIKLLRSMEHHVADLFYRHLNPLIQVAVNEKDTVHGGAAPPGYVDHYARLINETPPNGVIVTDGQTVIHAIPVVEGIPGKDYLDYFATRVMLGMGLSDVVLGVGNTSNRGTSDTMVAQMRDNIKFFQESAAWQFTNFIINELLLEGGIDVLNPKNRVEAKFREVDVDLAIKKEEHTISLWNSNLITHLESRLKIGKKPLTPAEEKELYSNKVEKDMIRFEGDVNKDIAQTKVNTINRKQNDKSKATKKRDSTKNLNTSKMNPSNQHGKKVGPKRKTAEDEVVDNLLGWASTVLTVAIDSRDGEFDVNKDIDNPLVIVGERMRSLGFEDLNIVEFVIAGREAVKEYLDGADLAKALGSRIFGGNE